MVGVAVVVTACSGQGAVTTSTATTPSSMPATAATAPATTQAAATAPPPTTRPAPRPPLVVFVDEVRAPVVAAIGADAEAATGVAVVVEGMRFDEIRAAVAARRPDVFLGSDTWTRELVDDGLVAPLDLPPADYLPLALEAFTVDGAQYALPFALEAIALYRNTDLAPEAPATIEELIATCDRLGAAVRPCLAIPAGEAYHHYPFLASAGGYVFGHADGRYDVADAGLSSPGAVAGFEVLDRLVGGGTVDPAVDYGAMTDRFFNGEAAFMWTGPWELRGVQGAQVPYAVSSLPAIAGSPAVPAVGAQAFFVHAGSQQRDLAERFVLDHLGTPAAMAALQAVRPRVPAHRGALRAAAVDQDIQAFGDSAAGGELIPGVPRMDRAWEALGGAVRAIYERAAGPQEALDAAQAVLVGG